MSRDFVQREAGVQEHGRAHSSAWPSPRVAGRLRSTGYAAYSRPVSWGIGATLGRSKPAPAPSAPRPRSRTSRFLWEARPAFGMHLLRLGLSGSEAQPLGSLVEGRQKRAWPRGMNRDHELRGRRLRYATDSDRTVDP